MKRLLFGVAAALALAVPAHAEQKLSTTDCDTLWKQANPQNLEKLPEASAAAYITDMKAANPDGDTTIEKDEFAAACSNGLIRTTSGTTKQPAPSETSDRTPEKETPTPSGQVDTSEGETSDRTPAN